MFHIENQCAHEEQRQRYERRNAARRRSRSMKNQLLFPDLRLPGSEPIFYGEETTMMPTDDRNIFICNDESGSQGTTHSTKDMFEYDEPRDSASSLCATESTTEAEDSTEPIETRLHHYTNVTTHHYCSTFIELARKAHVCKSRTNDFLSFLRSGLPVPNRMPASDKHLLALLNVKELFTKRSICIRCREDFDYRRNTCPRCKSEETNSIAHVLVSLHCVAMHLHSIPEKELYSCHRRFSSLIIGTMRTQWK